MERLKKSLVVSLMTITALTMTMVTAPVASAASDGDLVKIEGDSAVFYLADGKKHVFPNSNTYFSWYSDFNAVQIVTVAELDQYTQGANVTMRAGTKLVTSPTTAMVYAVEPGGALRSIVSEANAIELYGADWASNVTDVISAFMSNYVIGSPLVEGDYPAGTLIQEEGDATVYYVGEDGSARQFADEAAFTANRFQFTNVVTTYTGFTLPSAGDAVTSTEGLGDTSQGGAGTGTVVDPNVGSGVSISLASDTPAAGNIPENASTEFLKINLAAANDGDVNVTTIVLTAYDLGDSTDIDDVTFYDNGIKVGSSKDMNSDRIATFNFSDLMVEAGTTKTLTVKAKLYNTVSVDGNFALGVASASDITTNGATVSGSFPVVGNTKAAVTGVDVGTAVVSVNHALTGTAEFGEDEVLLLDIDIDTAEEPIIFESAMFRNGGDDVVTNLVMFIDGVEVSTSDMNGDYVTFDLDNYLVDKGDNITVEVYGDISGSVVEADDEVQLYIDDENDLVMVGQDYGYGVTPDIDDIDSKTEAKTITIETGDVAIDVDKSSTSGTPAMDIENDRDNVVIATFSIVSAGSNAVVNSIDYANGTFAIDNANATTDVAINTLIENVELVALSGGTYDVEILNPAEATIAGAAEVELKLDEEISLAKGEVKTFQLRMDTFDTVEEDTTFVATFDSAAFDIETEDGDAIANITGGGSGATMTIKEADFDWTTTALVSKSLVTGATGIEIYRASLEAGDVSGITLSSVTISDLDVDESFGDDQINDLMLYIDGVKIDTASGDIVENGAAANYITFNSLSYDIAAGESVVLDLRANFSSSFTTTGSFSLVLAAEADIDAKDDDNDAVSDILENATAPSRTITLSDEGNLKVELKIDDKDANDDTLILAGSSNTSNDKYVGELEITTENEPIVVETLVLEQLGTAVDTDVKAVILYNEAGSAVATQAPDVNGHVDFDSLNLTVGADETISLFIGVETKSINALNDNEGTAASAATVQFALASDAVLTTLGIANDESVTAQGVDSGVEITMVKDDLAGGVEFGEYSTDATVTMTTTIVGSLLTAIENSMVTEGITGGTNVIGQYKFVFDNGSNRAVDNSELKADLTSLLLTTSAGGTVVASVASVVIYNVDDESTTVAGVAVNGATGSITFADLSALDTVDGEVTLEVKAVVTTDGTDGAYFETRIADLSAGDFVFDGGHAILDPLLSKNDIDGGKLD